MKHSQSSTVGIISLGCPRNLVDSESILGRFISKGFRIVDIGKADIGIVNTCAFIKEAKEESIDAILDLIKLKKKGPLKKILVYGCFSQRYKDELTRHLPEVDAFIGRISLEEQRPKKRYSLTPSHFAYLKIAEGCGNKCSYCVIPYIKGKFHSRSSDSIIEQVKALDAAGLAELNIVGQDITLYGRDVKRGSRRLIDLLREILKATKNIRWIRLLYLHPAHLDDELIRFIASEERICKYIDLPIQHINDTILKKMNRHITKKQITGLIKKVRALIPGVAIRTSLIVGFPGETEANFKELVNFIEEQKFERLGAFTYSREEGTLAHDFKNQIPQKTKQKRFAIIMKRQQQVASELNSRLLGRTLEALIDEAAESKNLYLGRTPFDAPEVDGLVYVRSARKLKSGEIVTVRITDTYEYDLVGEAL